MARFTRRTLGKAGIDEFRPLDRAAGEFSHTGKQLELRLAATG